MSVGRRVSFSPEVTRVTFKKDDSYDVKTERLKEEEDKSSAIRKALSAEGKQFAREEIKSLEDRQIELVDVIQRIENDAERDECFLEMGKLKIGIEALKQQL